jgi:hypothetical protein
MLSTYPTIVPIKNKSADIYVYQVLQNSKILRYIHRKMKLTLKGLSKGLIKIENKNHE